MTTAMEEAGLRRLTEQAIDAIAKDAIRWGTNPIKLWTQVSTRIVAAVRTSVSAEEWGSAMLRSLRIQTPNVKTSTALADLAAAVGPTRRERDAWLSMVEREAGFLVAAIRAERDAAKAEREAGKETKPRRSRAKAQAAQPPTETTTDAPPTPEDGQKDMFT